MQVAAAQVAATSEHPQASGWSAPASREASISSSRRQAAPMRCRPIGWAQRSDARPRLRSDPRAIRVGRRSDAALRAVHPGDDLRRRLRADRLAMEFSAAAAVVGVRGTIDGRTWTSDPIPEDTSRGNFTAHWGGGVRLRPRGANALLLAYRFQHFSNGNQLGSNPGVNSHVFPVRAGLTARSFPSSLTPTT